MSSTGTSSGLSAFQNSYEISPIVLTGGSAQSVPGGMLPIINLLQPGAYASSIISAQNTSTSGGSSPANSGGASSNSDLTFPFAKFIVMSGSTLEDIEIAHYPFGNLTIAANAVVVNPLKVSILMIAPAQAENGGYTNKNAAFTALKQAIDQHIQLGGSFNVATPSYIYTGCLLNRLVDSSAFEPGGQVQYQYTWEFEQPLITLQAAQQAQNQLMQRFTNQTSIMAPISTSGPQNSPGNPFSPVATATSQNSANTGAANQSGPPLYQGQPGFQLSTQGHPTPAPSTVGNIPNN